MDGVRQRWRQQETRAGNFELHRRAVAAVAQRLRRRGCHVATIPQPSALSLLVQPPSAAPRTVAVRVARALPHPHHVCVGGRHYRYVYEFCGWNLHEHGRPLPTPPDYWILVPAGDLAHALVVPSRALRPTRLTVSLPTRCRRRGVRSALRDFAGKWELVAGGGR